MPDAPKLQTARGIRQKPAAKRAPAKRADDTVVKRRSGALSLVQMAGRWEPFVGPTGRVFWRVPSERTTAGGSRTYTVFAGEGTAAPSCTCPDESHPRPGRPVGHCKHILAVQTYQRVVKTHAKHAAAMAAILGGSARGHRVPPQPGRARPQPAGPAAAGR